MSEQKDWEILAAQPSSRGGLHIQGINHCTPIEIDRQFRWEIDHWSIFDPRFDWSKCQWGPGAIERSQWIRRIAIRGGHFDTFKR